MKKTEKHLQVTYDFETGKLYVTGQTDRGPGFVGSDDYFKGRSGVVMRSSAYPEYRPGHRHTPPVLYVRGVDGRWDRASAGRVPIDKLPGIIKAVREYNKRFGTPKKMGRLVIE